MAERRPEEAAAGAAQVHHLGVLLAQAVQTTEAVVQRLPNTTGEINKVWCLSYSLGENKVQCLPNSLGENDV